jgi:hypothetical protein
MKNATLMTALLAAASLTVATGAWAETGSKNSRDAAVRNAEAEYKMDKATCDKLSGNAKDVCIEVAKGQEKVAKAEAEAAYDNTPKAREKVRVARADAAYDVAKEKCDDLAGNAKDVCVKEAKASHVKALADAKVERTVSEERLDASDRTMAARREAAEDKREADYKVAVEKCDALAGTAKDACIREAKSRFRRTM